MGKPTGYSDDLKMKLVQEVDAYREKGMNVKEACGKAEISYSMYNTWKVKFGLQPSQAVRAPKEEIHVRGYWDRYIKEWESSGMSKAAFAREKGIPYNAFCSAIFRYKNPHYQAKAKPKETEAVRKIVPIHMGNGHDEEIKILRAENTKLRLLISDFALDVAALKEFCGRK